MERKGDFLVKHLLGILIAVACIFIFIVAFMRLYEINANAESEKAKKVLNIIMGKADSLKDGEKGAFTIQGIKGWHLVGWNAEDDFSIKPERCFSESCVCVCPSDSKNSCQDKGICRLIGMTKVNVSTGPSAKSGAAYGLDADFTIHRACIPLRSNLMEILISKDTDFVSLSYNGQAELGDFKFCTKLAGDSMPERSAPYIRDTFP